MVINQGLVWEKSRRRRSTAIEESAGIGLGATRRSALIAGLLKLYRRLKLLTLGIFDEGDHKQFHLF
jgi:hypothetical protein